MLLEKTFPDKKPFAENGTGLFVLSGAPGRPAQNQNKYKQI